MGMVPMRKPPQKAARTRANFMTDSNTGQPGKTEREMRSTKGSVRSPRQRTLTV